MNARIKEYEHRSSAARFDLETAAMSVAAELASDWIELVTVREEISLVKRQTEINTILLELIELRFSKAMSTALDVLQQREAVARSRAGMPLLEIKEKTLERSIALLCAKPDPGRISITTERIDDIPPIPSAGIPADLLSNRPDIKSAAQRLSSSQWALFQAEADRLPSLNLTGSFLFQHSTLDTILKNWILALGSRLRGTIFDGGEKDAAVDFASGVIDENFSSYANSVYTAIMEVENAITAERYRNCSIDLLKTELGEARLALEEAKNRYMNGIDTFIPVVTEQLNVQNLEMDLLEQKDLLFKNRIELYRAIGGSWYENLM